MVTLLGNTTKYGVFILADNSGWVAANNPGLADLDALIEGTGYIFIDDWTLMQRPGKNDFQVMDMGDGIKRFYTYGDNQKIWRIRGILPDTEEELCEKFDELTNRIDAVQKYLVIRRGSTDYKQFPNDQGALKKYVPIILVGCIPSKRAEDKDWDMILECLITQIG